MYSAVKSEAKVVYKVPLFVDEEDYFMTVFVQEAPIEENTSSECIRTVAATCGCKILQLDEYEVNECRYEENCE